MADPASPFAVQKDVRVPWRKYLDEPRRCGPSSTATACRLTGNVWDGEDLVQEALLRVFGQLGKLDPDLERLEHPRAYLVRTATRIWIDQRRGRRAHGRSSRWSDAWVSATPMRGSEIQGARPKCVKRPVSSSRSWRRASAPAILLKDSSICHSRDAKILHTTVAADEGSAAARRGASCARS